MGREENDDVAVRYSLRLAIGPEAKRLNFPAAICASSCSDLEKKP